MQTEMTMDIDTHITDEQKRAVEDAKRYIAEDHDRLGRIRMLTDFTVRVDQVGADREIVRTWIAWPNGKLGWNS